MNNPQTKRTKIFIPASAEKMSVEPVNLWKLHERRLEWFSKKITLTRKAQSVCEIDFWKVLLTLSEGKVRAPPCFPHSCPVPKTEGSLAELLVCNSPDAAVVQIEYLRKALFANELRVGETAVTRWREGNNKVKAKACDRGLKEVWAKFSLSRFRINRRWSRQNHRRHLCQCMTKLVIDMMQRKHQEGRPPAATLSLFLLVQGRLPLHVFLIFLVHRDIQYKSIQSWNIFRYCIVYIDQSRFTFRHEKWISKIV